MADICKLRAFKFIDLLTLCRQLSERVMHWDHGIRKFILCFCHINLIFNLSTAGRVNSESHLCSHLA